MKKRRPFGDKTYIYKKEINFDPKLTHLSTYGSLADTFKYLWRLPAMVFKSPPKLFNITPLNYCILDGKGLLQSWATLETAGPLILKSMSFEWQVWSGHF